MKYIVTDMGGVLIDLYWEFYAAKMLGKEYSLEELQKLWVISEATKNFETGKSSFDEFASAIILEFKVKLTPEEIKKNFCAITGPPKPKFFELFADLKKNFNLSILSNTNMPHVQYLRSKYNLFEIFDNLFFSYEIGLMKPFPEIFMYVIKSLKANPEDILFFDDSKLNVDAAAKLGINSFVVTSPQEIYDIVNKFQ
ncbi:MAG: HAD-IA family hydrolase [Lentisphaerota bacterium]